MSPNSDVSDFVSGFMCTPHPSCILEPVNDSDGRLIDVVFRHTNVAFDREYTIPPDQRRLMPLMLREGIEGTSFFKKLDGMQAAENVKFSLGVLSTVSWYQCIITKLTTGNFLVVVEAVSDMKTAEHIESSVVVELPEDVNKTTYRLIVNPLDGTILAASNHACAFYGYPRAALRGMSVRDLIVGFEYPEVSPPEEPMGRPSLLAIHRRADGQTVKVAVWSFVARWDGHPAVFMVIEPQEDTVQFPLSGGRALRDRLGRQIDETMFDNFIEAYPDVSFIRELLVSIIPHGVLVKYPQGSHFCEFGEISQSVGFILKGFFRQYSLSPDGKDHTIDFYRAGRFLDSYSYILCDRPSIVAFEARSDCLVYCVDLKVLKRIALADLRWYRLFYYNLVRRLVGQYERDYSLLCEDAMARYARFIAQYGDIAPFLKSYHIASYLGITSETLSRIRKNLNENIIG